MPAFRPAPVSKDEALMAMAKRFRDCVVAYREKGPERTAALAVIGEWKVAIDAGQGTEWAKENRERFEKAMSRAQVGMDFEKILEGEELAAAVGEVFEVVPPRAEPSPEPGLPCGPDRAIHDEPKGEGVPEQAALPEVRRMGQ